MVAELVRAGVRLIFATGNNLTARVATSATATIPVVFAMGGDPEQLYIAGVRDQIQIRLQLLHDTLPTAKVFGLIINPDNFGRSLLGGGVA